MAQTFARVEAPERASFSIDAALDTTARQPVLDLVVPVHNEEAVLASSIERLLGYLGAFPFSFRVSIADNASTDRTWEIACRLTRRHPSVRAVHRPQKGRGGALRSAWMTSDAEVVAYTDVDLSTDLDALLPLVAPLVSGHSDVAIGSRLVPGARVVRGPKRELVSRAYNLILRIVARARFRDAQCGFKALRRDTAGLLLPLVENDNWFFDTELLLLAQRNGLRIHEVPVDWVDDPDSKVNVVATALEDLRGLARLTRRSVPFRAGARFRSRRPPARL
ncbi:MAG: hypothetical protein JJLCMIEE_01653 [Acidimicrobiales bacterium]|nr:MAG: glycosyltransferase family 2 protein [Actinomycetota bacterium]MBV6508588.1 hypothetical protein [Acidimicrobiales bacterium]RIK05108.1 MAG: glycosyl transferase [Acidobacteriota bacterium]